MPRLMVLKIFVTAILASSACAPAAEPLFRFDLGGRTLEGTPLVVADKKAFFLLRDGALSEFAPDEATNYSRLSASFQSYSQAEIRGQLLREFGQGYDVSGVGHYLVVHPAGKRDEWAPRFEELYRSFLHYFAARGWQLPEPQFPLIAVVYARQIDFWQQAARDGVPLSTGLLGYYSPISNRISMFDASVSNRGWDWTTNANTIIHEAAHQTAFNTRVHSRFAHSPRWLVEGLATMFEARGVWQSGTYRNQADRINRIRYADWQKRAAGGRPQDAIAQLVSSDSLFTTDPQNAYAEAWALSFFLMETMPKKYSDYLGKLAGRPPFAEYRSPERLRDFSDVFGNDLRMLSARLQRFMSELK